RKAAEEPHDVMEHEHLTIAVCTRTDADGWNADPVRHELRQLRGHELQNHAPATRDLEGDRTFDDAPCALIILALQPVAAERACGLRREADMPQHRNAGLDERLDNGNDFRA